MGSQGVPVLSKEPAAFVGVLTSIASSVIALLVAFGADITPEQRIALLGAVATLAPVLSAILIRARVYAPETVDRIDDASWHDGYEEGYDAAIAQGTRS